MTSSNCRLQLIISLLQVIGSHQRSPTKSTSQHLMGKSVELDPVQCQDYSFDFTFKSGVESAYRHDNITGSFGDIEDWDYEMFNVTYVEPTDYSEASYNFLLFPFLQPFKAPNVVATSNLSEEVPTEEFNVSISDLLKYDVLEDLEGCYPYVVPYLALSFQPQDADQNNTLTTEAGESLREYQELYTSLRGINDAIETSHVFPYNFPPIFSSIAVSQTFNMIGSYFGVAFRKDLTVMKCYMQEKLPKSFEDLTTHFKTIQIERPPQEGEDGGFVYSVVHRSTSVLSSFLPSYVPLVRSLQETLPLNTITESLSSFSPWQRSFNVPFTLPCSDSLTNLCWRKTISSVQESLTKENIASMLNSFLPTLDCLHKMMDMVTSVMKMIAGMEDFNCLACSYDIIANDDLVWDSNKPMFSGQNLLHEMVMPIGRDTITTLPVKIKKTYENMEHGAWSLVLLLGQLRNRTSEIVESESLADVIQQKCNSVLDWVGDVDVEAVQLNGLLFVNAVANCVTNQDDTAAGVGPLVNLVLQKIQTDQFWVELEKITLNLVNERWRRVLAVINLNLAPALDRLSLSLDWLNLDWERNTRHLVELAVKTINEKLQGQHGLGRFSLRRILSQTPEALQCSKEAVTDEDVWNLINISYTVLTAGLDYLEPTFGLFQPSSVCQLLDMCEVVGQEVSQAAQELKNKMIEMFTPLMKMKRAIFCRNNIITKAKYWGSILQ